MPAMPPLRFLVFKSDGCAHCAALDKQQTIEKFITKHCAASTKIHRLSCADKDGETPDGTDYYKAYKLSDDYGVEMFPTVILEARLPDGSGLELSRTEGGVSSRDFDKTFTQALEAYGEQVEADEGRSQNEASKDLSWA